MAKNFSPEEKLLQLIRSKGKAKARPGQKEPAQDEAPQARDKAAGPRAEEVLTNRQVSNLRRTKRTFNASLAWGALNITLALSFAGLFAYFLYIVFWQPPAAEVNDDVTPGRSSQPVKAARPQKHPFTHYSDQIGTRNIFQPVSKEAPEVIQHEEEAVKKFQEIKESMSLLGIIGGDSPQAIIEDTKEKKTYFLNKGETFKDIVVLEILNGKVILDYKGKQLELML